MTTMFTSIVVALDLGSVGDRALPFTASLATLGGLPVELITISSPGMPTAVDLYELERRAKGYGLEHFSCHVLHDDDSGAAIVAHMASRPDALLVMGSSAKGPVAGHLLGSVSEYVLGHIEQPRAGRSGRGLVTSPDLADAGRHRRRGRQRRRRRADDRRPGSPRSVDRS